MHPISFQLRRAHLAAGALERMILEGRSHVREAKDPEKHDAVQDMTPVRFHLLHLIHERCAPRGKNKKEPELGYRMALMDIAPRLNMKRQTAWKLVKRCIELGLVSKEAHPGSRRCKLIRLTALGIKRIREAYHRAWTERRLSRFYRRYFEGLVTATGRAKNLAARCEEAIDRFWFGLVKLGRRMGLKTQDSLYERQLITPLLIGMPLQLD